MPTFITLKIFSNLSKLEEDLSRLRHYEWLELEVDERLYLWRFDLDDDEDDSDDDHGLYDDRHACYHTLRAFGISWWQEMKDVPH